MSVKHMKNIGSETVCKERDSLITKNMYLGHPHLDSHRETLKLILKGVAIQKGIHQLR